MQFFVNTGYVIINTNLILIVITLNCIPNYRHVFAFDIGRNFYEHLVALDDGTEGNEIRRNVIRSLGTTMTKFKSPAELIASTCLPDGLAAPDYRHDIKRKIAPVMWLNQMRKLRYIVVCWFLHLHLNLN